MHAFEGEVLVRIWDDANDLNSLGTHCLNTSLTLAIPSGTLVVGDVERNTVVTASVQPGHYDIHIFADAPEQPEIVDLVLVPARDEFVKQAGRTVEGMSLPLMRDPRQRDPRLQLIIKVVVFAGMGIGGLLIAIVALSRLMS
ncbi:MAG TPA: hypothetical protein DGG94_14190 [Micromonosporaceae bacterium]|nr:hypothetical protein [Micromonosporaceae bacterium]HCU50926.1 hypothetical protein [Micromonosporaceae bacterium]